MTEKQENYKYKSAQETCIIIILNTYLIIVLNAAFLLIIYAEIMIYYHLNVWCVCVFN